MGLLTLLGIAAATAYISNKVDEEKKIQEKKQPKTAKPKEKQAKANKKLTQAEIDANEKYAQAKAIADKKYAITESEANRNYAIAESEANRNYAIAELEAREENALKKAQVEYSRAIVEAKAEYTEAIKEAKEELDKAIEEAKEERDKAIDEAKENQKTDIEVGTANTQKKKSGETTRTDTLGSGLYDSKIEELINCALIDGKLSEKEKQVLLKKAETQGIDLDEFEMVLDARIVQFEKAEREKAQKSNKHGEVKKCPNCGATVQSYQGECHECGYEFENIEANAAVIELSSMLKSAKNYKEKERLVRTFPIPSTKANLIELMSYLQTNVSDNVYGDACISKLQECIIKAKTLFYTDTHLSHLIKNIEEAIEDVERKRKEIERTKIKGERFIMFLKFLGWFILVILTILEWVFLYGKLDWGWFWVLLINGLTLSICVIFIIDLDEK